jgi:hypothetical protein
VSQPLQTVTGPQGQPVGLVTPGADWLADIVRRYAADVAAQAARDRAIRAGLLPPAPRAERWDISDRH